MAGSVSARASAVASRRELPKSETLLATLARRTRHLRQTRGLTLQALAARSGLSRRFLMDVEAGRGNISVRRLADLAVALAVPAAELITADTASSPGIIALLGLRGAGKTTIGRRLARRLRLPFVELDQRIEARAGLALGEVFSLHGEEYYRRVEREALDEVLSSGDRCVLAVGGGLVTSPEAFGRLRSQARTIWLKARPADYWQRVIRQGDRRPIEQHPRAREALRELVVRREPLYARADATVDTTGLTVAQSVARVDAVVDQLAHARTRSTADDLG
jgi:XRE family transcriptional regulator, aerobic/anaerobic benzoate catabolism transcriptional regulator